MFTNKKEIRSFRWNIRFWLAVLGWILWIPNSLSAQDQTALSLQICYQKAEENYPLIQQYELLEKSESYSLDQIASGNFPQIRLGGQWSYQSEVTQIPFSLPGNDIPGIDKDQYKVYVDVAQPLTDLFTLQKSRKDLVQKEASVRVNALDSEIYKLKERINQLYFGILLIDRQIVQANLLKEQVESGIQINRVAVANGIALKSSVSLLEAESLKIEKRLIELKANRKAFMERLSLFIGENIEENTEFGEPNEVPVSFQINRPELDLFQSQKEVFQSQKRLVENQNLPSLSLFGQGGYGKPGLNMLSNQSDFYYLAGLRFSWDITRLYNRKKDKKKLDIQQDIIEVEKETFLFNTNQFLQSYRQEILKMEALIAVDLQIIERRKEITQTAEIQLENGVLTTNDYLTYLHEEDEAQQELLLHQIKRLKAMYDYKTTSGN